MVTESPAAASTPWTIDAKNGLVTSGTITAMIPVRPDLRFRAS